MFQQLKNLGILRSIIYSVVALWGTIANAKRTEEQNAELRELLLSVAKNLFGEGFSNRCRACVETQKRAEAHRKESWVLQDKIVSLEARIHNEVQADEEVRDDAAEIKRLIVEQELARSKAAEAEKALEAEAKGLGDYLASTLPEEVKMAVDMLLGLAQTALPCFIEIGAYMKLVKNPKGKEKK
jgi:hypothetical protein